ncbi:MAG: LLM class flavin-dependent oxidoreductase [Proteobacteria bacterium]|nr:LLM class flavin-dependent oxidoreductase [Pseudomonadota bacterium]HQR04242.1 LLM class flavin-dependent oxidoreductase [Rhodocyclaceae bacterium]
MKFSLIYEAQTAHATRAGDRQIFDEIVEQAVVADEMGFDVFWCVDHTSLTYYAHMSAPETVLPYVAGRTRNIGIGHGVVCLPVPMNHPVKVAERVATLDLLSHGRVHFGVGKGGTQQEAGTFGYNVDEVTEMVDEMMYLIPKIMTEKEIEYNGKYVQIPKREIRPKPYQDPHPLMYLATTNTESLIKAGKRGIGALVLGFGGPEEVAKKNKIYRDAWASRDPAEQVGQRPNQHLAALCPTLVLDDGLLARKIGIRGQRFFLESLAYWYTGGPKPDWDTWALEGGTNDGTTEGGVIKTSFANEAVTVDFSDPSQALLNPNHAYGTVDDCIKYVEKLQEAGADEILFLCQMGTVPQWAQLETIRNIGKHVIPYFRTRRRS